jgi:DNA-binding MarR family transcriptional regulator
VDPQELRSTLDRVRAIRHVCDLDLLMFFWRHPCALLGGEQLAAHLGYDPGQIERSLDGLIRQGLLRRSQNPSHAARLHVLQLHGVSGELLPPLLNTAATREGRLHVRRLLQSDRVSRAGRQVA